MTATFFISCSSIDIDEYENRQPSITLESFFSGELVAYGIVRNRSGKVTRYFQASLKGSWVDGVGTLDEVFFFDDGEKQTRVWTMKPQQQGTYIGTASDVIGEAKIETSGNAIRLNYNLEVPYKDDKITLSMDDWMYQVVPGVVINETVMKKFGFTVGKVTLVIMRTDSVENLTQPTGHLFNRLLTVKGASDNLFR